MQCAPFVIFLLIVCSGMVWASAGVCYAVMASYQKDVHHVTLAASLFLLSDLLVPGTQIYKLWYRGDSRNGTREGLTT